jgi:hypothetical protein
VSALLSLCVWGRGGGEIIHICVCLLEGGGGLLAACLVESDGINHVFT